MKSKYKIALSYVLTAIIICVAAALILSKFVRLGNVEYTDNAQVCQQIVPVNSRVQGYIKEVRFREFEPIKKGDTLVVIDDTEHQISLAQAKANLQMAQEAGITAESGVNTASANIGVSEASVNEAKVLMDNAGKDYERYKQLLAKGAVTQREYDDIRTSYEAKRARYETLRRQSAVAVRSSAVSRGQERQSRAAVDLAQVKVQQAQQNLSYCVIVAPCDGYASRKDIQVGQLVQPGQTLLDIVDSNDIWITANFKETQLRHIHAGSKVRIQVDAVEDCSYEGSVEAISSATGAAVSLIKQDNSSGNFVKVRQRIPVRIRFSEKTPRPDIDRLRAGMNVECEVEY